MADAQINNFVTRVRTDSTVLLDIYNHMVALSDEYTKLGLSAAIIQAELDGLNLEVTGTEIAAVITSIGNLTTYMNAGNGTNLYKVKP